MPSVASISWLCVTALIVVLASMDVGLGAQAYLGLGAVITMFLLFTFNPQGWLRYALLAFAIFVSLRYLLWRVSDTLPPIETAGFVISVALILAECHAFTLYLLGIISTAKLTDRVSPPLPTDPDELPTVDVFIPTYNEPVSVVEKTVLAATQLAYPRDKLKVHVLDDGGTNAKLWENPSRQDRAKALRELCVQAGATYRTRVDNREAKAGNINVALEDTSGDLVLILDCDHIPTVDFLQRTVGLFCGDPDLAFVQTPHFFRNPDPVERNLDTFDWMPGEGEIFYGHGLRGMDHCGAAFFCGSAALLSRRALQAVGGISSNSITEDADTALNMHALGFKSAYIARPMVAGLAPDTLAAFVQQRTRWCQGMLQILLLNNPLTKNGLQLRQRLAYLSSTLYWLFSFTRLIFLLAPLAYIIFDIEIMEGTWPEFVAFIVPHIFVTFSLNNYINGSYRFPFISDVYESVQSIFLAPAVVEVLRNPRKAAWKVTPKDENLESDFFSQLALPVALLFLTIAATEAYGVWRLFNEPYNVQYLLIVLVWNTLNLVVMAAAVGSTLERGSRVSRLWLPVATRGFLERDGQDVPVLIDRSNGEHANLVLNKRYGPGLARGDLINIQVEHGLADIASRFSARVVGEDRQQQSAFRVELTPETLDEHRAIVAMLYGSSERWHHFEAARRNRRSIFGGLIRLMRLTLDQFGDILGFLVEAVVRGPAPAAVPSVPARPSPLHAVLRTSIVALLAFAILAFNSTAVAQADDGVTLVEAPSLAARPEAVGPTVRVLALRSLTPDNDMPMLDDINPNASFQFVLNPTADVQAVQLRLGYVTSPEMAADPEGLALRLNGEIVDHLPLVPSGTQQDKTVTLAPELLRPGLNALDVIGVFAEGDGCSQPRAGVWTTLTAGPSYLRLETQKRPGAVTLADLDRSGWRWVVADREITLATLGPPNERQLSLGATLAGAIGLRRGQAGLAVRHRSRQLGTDPNFTLPPAQMPLAGLQPDDLNPGLNVVFGTADDLRGILHPKLIDRVDRPVIGVHRFASAPDRVVLVLAGQTDRDLRLAAAALADPQLVLPDAAWAELPETAGRIYAQERTLRGLSQYRFDTRELLEFDAERQALTFNLPTGFTAFDNRKLELDLHFAYAPGLPAGSMMQVLANDQIVRQIRFKNPNGDLIEGRRVRMELAHLRPGLNEIVFRPALFGREADACNKTMTEWFEVFANSEIRLPELVTSERFPDLALLKASDGPLTAFGGRDTTIVLGDVHPDVVGSAWTLATQLAANQGRPLTQLEIRVGHGGYRRHVVWVGTSDVLDPRLAAQAGLGDIILDVADRAEAEALGAGGLMSRRSAWAAELANTRHSPAAQQLLHDLLATLGLGNGGATGDAEADPAAALEAIAPPWLSNLRFSTEAFFRLDRVPDITPLPADRPFHAALAGMARQDSQGQLGEILFLVAPTPTVLVDAVKTLVQPASWSELDGTAVAWRAGDPELTTASPVLPLENRIQHGRAETVLSYSNWFAANPLNWVALVLGVMLAIGGAAAVGLRDRKDQ